ncbi:helix-turn-helix domain-containing protein [Actinomadura formosensis]|uniref:helix-turn-helix domain-containing protein n=1 Tax=Actinomadura formosensis TaxID=60706 RepID=UPI001A955DAE|nr:helix-turn-helix transcriptional regulator [Actinomadura formosensis]
MAWHRVRRGMPQEVLAGLVGRTEDWLSKIENDRAALDRLSVIRALADALRISVFDIIDPHSPALTRREPSFLDVSLVRSALTDYRQLSPLLAAIEAEPGPPRLEVLRRDVAEVMAAYQQSRYGQLLARLPTLLTQTHLATREARKEQRPNADRLAALANQSAAMILTKLGETDLAWIAAQRGLTAAERTTDPTIIGALFRSVIHALQSQGHLDEAASMTRQASRYLQLSHVHRSPTMLSIHGTLLLPGAIAAARAGNRADAMDYLARAEQMADELGTDANHLWTAFGPTNVRIHRVTAAMALGDVPTALDLIPGINTTHLPAERAVRHSLEVVNAYRARNKIDEAISELLTAERRAAEQIHAHVMSRQLVHQLRNTTTGRRSRLLADLARRMNII